MKENLFDHEIIPTAGNGRMPPKAIIDRNPEKEGANHYLHGRSATTVSVADTAGSAFRVSASGSQPIIPRRGVPAGHTKRL